MGGPQLVPKNLGSGLITGRGHSLRPPSGQAAFALRPPAARWVGGTLKRGAFLWGSRAPARVGVPVASTGQPTWGILSVRGYGRGPLCGHSGFQEAHRHSPGQQVL